MEDKFNYDEFEEFLQDQVRNHRMYPGDAVWREIDRKLHGEKRWPALTIAAAMLVGATVLICVYFTPKPNIFTLPTANVNTSTPPASDKNNILNNITSSIPFTKAKISSSGGSRRSELINNEQTALNTIKVPATTANLEEAELEHINAAKTRSFKNISGAASIVATNRAPGESMLNQTEGLRAKNEGIKKSNENQALIQNTNEKELRSKGGLKKDNDVVNYSTNQHNRDVDSYLARKKSALKNKFSYQVYVAPSVSYRKLLEDNPLAKENVGGPVGINFVTDVNKVVRHKPGTGIEAGASAMYNVSRRVRLKAGFQFNMRQYSISAYRSNTEMASIALIGNNRLDTINTIAIYRTNNGYYSAELVNRYYQVSAPLGVEWEILGNSLIQFNIAGTIQPTYLLNRNAYLLSTNFKNYTESPGMVRQWNINSNIEAFVSVKSGDYKWQLGPQLRYQPYSTFIPEYPIKEHLLDYGIKLGFTKTLK